MFVDFRLFSQMFVDFRRCLPILVDFRRVGRFWGSDVEADALKFSSSFRPDQNSPWYRSMHTLVEHWTALRTPRQRTCFPDTSRDPTGYRPSVPGWEGCPTARLCCEPGERKIIDDTAHAHHKRSMHMSIVPVSARVPWLTRSSPEQRLHVR